MSPSVPQFESQGRFVKIVDVRPAVEVDCSDWPAGEGSTGQFVKHSSVRAALEVDCSDWSKVDHSDGGVGLELTFRARSDGDREHAYLAVADLILQLSDNERTLGGTGLTRDQARSTVENGAVTIVLAPLQPHGGAERMGQLCEFLARTANELQIDSRVSKVA